MWDRLLASFPQLRVADQWRPIAHFGRLNNNPPTFHCNIQPRRPLYQLCSDSSPSLLSSSCWVLLRLTLNSSATQTQSVQRTERQSHQCCRSPVATVS
ncbi:unnamed protein product [Jaminaea pallidilutea]